MISFEDCAAMCGLERAEIAAIAEHEHIPEIAASALRHYLMFRPDGEQRIGQMIADDLRVAMAEGRVRHAAELMMALRQFMSDHPSACATG